MLTMTIGRVIIVELGTFYFLAHVDDRLLNEVHHCIVHHILDLPLIRTCLTILVLVKLRCTILIIDALDSNFYRLAPLANRCQ